MTRRRAVVLSLAGLAFAPGCLGATGLGPGSGDGGEPDGGDGNATQVAQPNPSDPVPLPEPEMPDDPTEAAAGEYAAAYEEVRMHNELLADVEATITELGVSCEAVEVEADGDGHLVTVECGHWYEFESGTSVGIADGAPYRMTYLVSDGGIEQRGEREYVYDGD